MTDEIAIRDLMVQQAMDALRRFHQARGHTSPEEVERLGLRAVTLMEEVQEYQRRALGQPGHPFR
ncbi:hypothetical protein D3C77_403160 [compost metagenome]